MNLKINLGSLHSSSKFVCKKNKPVIIWPLMTVPIKFCVAFMRWKFIGQKVLLGKV